MADGDRVLIELGGDTELATAVWAPSADARALHARAASLDTTAGTLLLAAMDRLTQRRAPIAGDVGAALVAEALALSPDAPPASG
jgi:hypothetical protein